MDGFKSDFMKDVATKAHQESPLFTGDKQGYRLGDKTVYPQDNIVTNSMVGYVLAIGAEDSCLALFKVTKEGGKLYDYIHMYNTESTGTAITRGDDIIYCHIEHREQEKEEDNSDQKFKTTLQIINQTKINIGDPIILENLTEDEKNHITYQFIRDFEYKQTNYMLVFYGDKCLIYNLKYTAKPLFNEIEVPKNDRSSAWHIVLSLVDKENTFYLYIKTGQVIRVNEEKVETIQAEDSYDGLRIYRKGVMKCMID